MRHGLFRDVRILLQRTSPKNSMADAVASQCGIAAVEFAMVVLLLLVIAFGLVSYGVMFWAKQDLSQLAGEGARYALAASMTDTGGGSFAAQGCAHVENLLGQEPGLLNKESLDCSSDIECPWPSPEADAKCATIKLAYAVDKLPVAGLVGELAGFFSASATDWVPLTLTASSTVQLVSNDG